MRSSAPETNMTPEMPRLQQLQHNDVHPPDTLPYPPPISLARYHPFHLCTGTSGDGITGIPAATPLLLKATIDATLLLILLSPILYIFLFHPVNQHLHMRKQAEEALRQSQEHS